MAIIRNARMRDAKNIAKIVNRQAAKGTMLPIALSQIYDQLRDFVVLEEGERFLGCGALHVAWDDLGEIRSVVVDSHYRKRGLGKLLVNQLLQMAKELEIKKVFILTYQASYFSRLGFQEIGKDHLPHKIWRACLHCPKFPNCDEIAMQLEV